MSDYPDRIHLHLVRDDDSPGHFFGAANTQFSAPTATEYTRSDLYEALQARIEELEWALTKLADCDRFATLPDSIDGVRAIARAALSQEKEGE